MNRATCDHCGNPATLEGWAFPPGGSFPVVGCASCLTSLAEDIDVRIRAIEASS